MRHLRAGLVLEILRKRGVASAEFGYLCLTVGLQLWIKIPQFLFRKLFRHKIFTEDLSSYFAGDDVLSWIKLTIT